jgi:hypothetical protein
VAGVPRLLVWRVDPKGSELVSNVEIEAANASVRTGAERIADERLRQIECERWTPEHDHQHDNADLLAAAQCYLRAARALSSYGMGRLGHDEAAAYLAKRYGTEGCTAPAGVPSGWPWEASWWKPSTAERMLEKAGALIAAEIDRLGGDLGG